MASETVCFATFELIRVDGLYAVRSRRMNSPRMSHGYTLLTDEEKAKAEAIITEVSDRLADYALLVLQPDLADNVELREFVPATDG